MQERAEKLAPAAALALYLVLLGTVLVLAGVGGRLYGVLSDSRAANDARRASLTYVAARLRAADAAGAVRVESRPGGDALVLDDGSGYVTRLYADHGALVEEYAAADTDYMPAAAEKVADTHTFTVVQDGAQYIITTDDGEVRVTLHSAGRADE
ncbi:DUF4860 domain-containing protein [uncultured Gemmiger sp.]|uniref:DUF4860 domain-containing protein n=1 Tax=uncultured Gemmiger sp. TaxID=1623490 RepID=UPI002595A6D8|nr:DUF4860 domain-containing protein [uncultured Gemmiger sp.]